MSVLQIARNNTLAQLYLKEIEEAQQLKKKQGARSNEFLPQKREKRETKVIESQPLSGNDVILPRSSYKAVSYTHLDVYKRQISRTTVYGLSVVRLLMPVVLQPLLLK